MNGSRPPSNVPHDGSSDASSDDSEALLRQQAVTERSEGRASGASGEGGNSSRPTSGSKSPDKRNSRHPKERALLAEAHTEFREREDSAVHNLASLAEEIEHAKKLLKERGDSVD